MLDRGCRHPDQLTVVHAGADSAEDFNEGINVHRRTASLMLHTPMGTVTKDQRAIGKTTAFMLLYGTGFKPGGHFVDVMATGIVGVNHVTSCVREIELSQGKVTQVDDDRHDE